MRVLLGSAGGSKGGKQKELMYHARPYLPPLNTSYSLADSINIVTTSRCSSRDIPNEIEFRIWS